MKTTAAKVIALLTLMCVAIPASAQETTQNKADSTALADLYLGQNPPGKKAEIFAPDVFKNEPHDSPIISPDETWLIFQGMETGALFYQLIDGCLAMAANPLGFTVPEALNGIAISPSGNRIYFLLWQNNDENFFFIEKIDDRWTSPKSLGEEVNSFKTHWQFSIALNENLYFASDGIRVSVFDGKTHLKPVPVKLEDNSTMQGATPYVSPDESYLICSIDGDLFISYNFHNGTWTKPLSLGPEINSDQLELCPQISPNNKYLLLISRRDGPDFVTYWADAGFVEDLKPEALK